MDGPTTDAAAPQSGPSNKRDLIVGGGRIAAMVPQTLDEAWRIAQWVASANWAPKSYQYGKQPPNGASQYDVDPNKVMVGIMHGLEVGLTPLAALQSIAVINGMPSLWGDGALAVVRASPLFVGIKEEFIRDKDGAVIGARCTMTRRGEEPATTEFTLDDAKAANLLVKEGPWQTSRPRMLQMRARAFRMRDSFTDVLRGMHIAEEVQDYPVDVTTQGSHTMAEPAKPAATKTAESKLDQFAGSPSPPKPKPEKPADAPAPDPSVRAFAVPVMPKEYAAAFDTHGKWLAGYKWLIGILADEGTPIEAKVEVVTKHSMLIDSVRKATAQYREQMDKALAFAGITMSNEPEAQQHGAEDSEAGA